MFNLALFLLDGALVTVLSSRLRRAYVRERSARAVGEADLEVESALHLAAERDRAALATLQAVTASLSGARTPVEVADAILDRGLAALGAAAGGVSRVVDGGRAVEVIAVRGYPGSGPGMVERLDHSSHLRDAIRTGEPVFLPDLASWTARYPDSPPRALPGPSEGGAIAVLPLVAGAQDDRCPRLPVRPRPRVRRRARGTWPSGWRRPAPRRSTGRSRGTATGDPGSRSSAARRGWRSSSRPATRSGPSRTSRPASARCPALLVPAHADWCAIELLDDDARGLAIGATPGAEAAVERLAAGAPRSLGSWLVPGSADQGPTIVTTTGRGWPDETTHGPGVAALAELETRSLLATPIITAGGEPLGLDRPGRP